MDHRPTGLVHRIPRRHREPRSLHFRHRAKKEAPKASFSVDQALPVDDHLGVHSPIMIPTAMPSAIMIMVTTDNHRSAEPNKRFASLQICIPKRLSAFSYADL
jgi:hypothetical protein